MSAEARKPLLRVNEIAGQDRSDDHAGQAAHGSAIGRVDVGEIQVADPHRTDAKPRITVFYRDSENIYRVTDLEAFPWLIHGFGTRLAGIPAAFGQLATLKQIHSSSCVAAEGRSGVLGAGDALLEDQPGSVVAVKTADCIPILLVDERHQAV